MLRVACHGGRGTYDIEPSGDMAVCNSVNQLRLDLCIRTLHSTSLHNNRAAWVLEDLYVLQLKAYALSLRVIDRDGLDFVGKDSSPWIASGRIYLS